MLTEDRLNDKVRRLLRVIEKAGLFEKSELQPERGDDKPQHRKIIRDAARKAIVLLKNDGVLPLKNVRSIAVIGPYANAAQIPGGSSSSVSPHYVITPLKGTKNRAGRKIKNFWDKYLSTFQVTTPDESMNIMLNIHNPYQCYVTKTWSRYLSYYQLGLGSRGIGIRDSFQDVLSVLASVLAEDKDFIRTLLSFQKRDGSSLHQFNPLTMEGSVGDSAETEDRPHYYSDEHLWGILTVTTYLKETGDLSFLEDVIPFYDKDKQGNVWKMEPFLNT